MVKIEAAQAEMFATFWFQLQKMLFSTMQQIECFH